MSATHTEKWGVERSEPIPVTHYHLAETLVMGLFGLSLAGAGLIYVFWRWVRNVKPDEGNRGRG